MLEAVLCIGFMLTLLFGVSEYTFVFRTETVASNASRAGARVASATYGDATNQVTTATQIAATVAEALKDRATTDTPVFVRVFRANASGAPIGGDVVACATDCLRFSWNAATSAFTYQAGTWTAPDDCGTVIDSIGVAVRLSHRPTNSLVQFTRTIDQTTVMRLEPSPTCISSDP